MFPHVPLSGRLYFVSHGASVRGVRPGEPGLLVSRRVFLRTATAGVTAWSLLGCDRPDAVTQQGTAGLAGASGSVKRGPASQTVSFDGGWLFGPNAAGSDQPGYDDSALETVTLPHTVTPLSWDNWNPLTWERTWVYRKHFDAPAHTAGLR